MKPILSTSYLPNPVVKGASPMRSPEPQRQNLNNEIPTVYLTKEQIVRLAGLSCDALVGIQLHTDANDETYVYGEFVPLPELTGVDGTMAELECFTIEADGTYQRTT